MAATLIQSTHVLTGATVVSAILGTGGTGIPVTAGNMIVAYVGSPSSGRTCSASDNVNGAYHTDASGPSSCSICSFASSAGGTITVTGAITGASTTIVMIVEEWSGVQPVNPAVDKAGTNSGGANTTGTTGSTVTLSQADELQLALMLLNSTAGTTTTFAVAAPFTPSPASPFGTGVNIFMACGNNQPLSTTAVSATFNWTNSSAWRGCIATYQNTTNTGSLTGQTLTSTEGSLTSTAVNNTVVAVVGGSGKPRRSRFKPVYAKDVYVEEMARFERAATEATAQRIEVESKLEATPPWMPIPADILAYIADFERALSRAQARERRETSVDVPVSFKIPKRPAAEAYQRLQALAKVARHREQVALERLRKVRDRIDEDAATSFMQWMLAED